MRACSPKASLACLRAVLALGLREEPFYVVCEDCSGGCSLWQKGDGAVLRKHWEASRPHPKPQFVIPNCRESQNVMCRGAYEKVAYRCGCGCCTLEGCQHAS